MASWTETLNTVPGFADARNTLTSFDDLNSFGIQDILRLLEILVFVYLFDCYLMEDFFFD
jgi:hypothetical protein